MSDKQPTSLEHGLLLKERHLSDTLALALVAAERNIPADKQDVLKTVQDAFALYENMRNK